jgi:hypothetical protein
MQIARLPSAVDIDLITSVLALGGYCVDAIGLSYDSVPETRQ